MVRNLNRFSIQGALHTLDHYGRSLPVFNLRGQTKIHTYCGSLTSLSVYIIMLLFAVIKFNHLVAKHNPNIAQVLQKNTYDENDRFVPVDENFMLAFTLEDYLTGEVKDDPRYIKLIARIATQTGGESNDFEIGFHKCTEEDYASFMPPNKGSRGPIEKIKNNPKRGMWCFDWTDLAFYGNERNLNNARLEIIVLPCNHRLTQLGAKDDRMDPTCIADLEQQINYLGPLNMILYYNQ